MFSTSTSVDRLNISWENKQGSWGTGGLNTGDGCNCYSTAVVERVAWGP